MLKIEFKKVKAKREKFVQKKKNLKEFPREKKEKFLCEKRKKSF